MALRYPGDYVTREINSKGYRSSQILETSSEKVVPKSVVTSELVLDSFPERARKRKCIGAFQIFQVDTVSFPTICVCVYARMQIHDNARAPSCVEGSKLRDGAVQLQQKMAVSPRQQGILSFVARASNTLSFFLSFCLSLSRFSTLHSSFLLRLEYSQISSLKSYTELKQTDASRRDD